MQASSCPLSVESYRQHLILQIMLWDIMYELLLSKGVPEPWCPGVLLGISHMACTVCVTDLTQPLPEVRLIQHGPRPEGIKKRYFP